MGFKEFLNENEYTKATKWFTKSANDLDILKEQPKEVKIRSEKYTSYILKKDVNLQDLKKELLKRFPDLTIITQTQTQSIEIYE